MEGVHTKGLTMNKHIQPRRACSGAALTDGVQATPRRAIALPVRRGRVRTTTALFGLAATAVGFVGLGAGSAMAAEGSSSERTGYQITAQHPAPSQGSSSTKATTSSKASTSHKAATSTNASGAAAKSSKSQASTSHRTCAPSKHAGSKQANAKHTGARYANTSTPSSSSATTTRTSLTNTARTSANIAASTSATTTSSSTNSVVDGASLPLKAGTFSVGAPFGATGSWARYHTGQDLIASEGTPVYAVVSGTVVSGDVGSWAGNAVVIRAADGSSTLYAHLSTRAVQPGQKVIAGQQIGQVGQTGRAFGAHLHFEYYPSGVTPGDVYSATNPVTYLHSIGLSI